MEYKKCQNCGEKIHARTLKCPFCNSPVDENAEVYNDEDENATTQVQQDSSERESFDDKVSSKDPKIDLAIGAKDDVKDYVYKAEVRHSIEYTKPLSNAMKVFLSAFTTFPLMGQVIGGFFGVFFLTYEDNDRKSFGKSLIVLSIIMFLMYVYSLTSMQTMLSELGVTLPN